MPSFSLPSLAQVPTYLLAGFLLAAASAAHAASEQGVYFFKGGKDGAFPVGGLINVGGTLYGTTASGGGSSNCENGCGTVFSVTPAGNEKIIYAFKGGSDGIGPNATLIDVDGILYGTTSGGGKGGGTVFKVTPAGVETVVHAFGGADGDYPQGGLIYGGGGTIYGTTFYGGATNNGTVFRVTTAGAESVIYSFKFGSDGAGPNSKLIFVNNVLYGTTSWGGAPGDNLETLGNGTVFKVAAHGVETVLYAFKGGSDGTEPNSLVYVSGTLYGTTVGSTVSSTCTVGCGTVFKVTLSGAERVLYAFKGYDDVSSLMNVGNMLYGTTVQGGKSGSCSGGCGTVFQVTTAGAYTLLYSFGIDCCGVYPRASLLNVAGTLYGTTSEGGSSCNCGSVFALTPQASAKLEQP